MTDPNEIHKPTEHNVNVEAKFRDGLHARRSPTGNRFINKMMRLSENMPVGFFVFLLVGSFVTFIYPISILLVDNTLQRVLYIVFAVIFNFMAVWSYIQVFNTSPGNLPTIAFVETDVLAASNENFDLRTSVRFAVFTSDSTGRPRYCNICMAMRPDRSHHCSFCKKCVLRNDHHCPWVGHCVGLFNHKFFYLFLFYTNIVILFYIGTTLPFVVSLGDYDSIVYSALALLILATIFLLSVGFLFVYHTYLLFTNQTTFENQRPPYFATTKHDVAIKSPHYTTPLSREPIEYPFSLGSALKNWKAIMGDNPFLWFLPIATTKGDGLEFELNSELAKRLDEPINEVV